MTGEIKNFDLEISKEKDFYEMKCFSNENIEMGFITFKIYKNVLWIFKLATHQAFAHQGVGSALIDITEYFAITKNANRIEGKFVPDNEFARPFYEKNGYYVPNKTKSWDDYDENWILYKDLNAKKINAKISPNIKINQKYDIEI